MDAYPYAYVDNKAAESQQLGLPHLHTPHSAYLHIQASSSKLEDQSTQPSDPS
jgi:hypothetical protein